jgi:hypothetical protein
MDRYRNGRCRPCQHERDRTYYQTPNGKAVKDAAHAAYLATPEGRESQRTANRDFMRRQRGGQ